MERSLSGTRRRYLRLAAGASAVGIAGCTGSSEGDVDCERPSSFGTDIGEAASDALSVADDADDWSMRYKNAGNTGVSTALGPRENVVRGWEYTASGAESARSPGSCYPVFDDGRVYVATHDGASLVALDPATGTVAWRYDRLRSGGVPAVVGPTEDRLIVAPGENGLHAVAAQTGERRWFYGDGSFDHDGNVVAADGAVYANGRNGIHAVEIDSGQQRFTVEGNQVGAAADGALVLGDEPLRAVSTTDGTEQWRVPDAVPYGAVAIRNQDVYVGELGRVEAYTIGDGTHRWTYEGESESFENPTVTTNTVLVGSTRTEAGGGNLYAIDRTMGAPKWCVSYEGRDVRTTAAASGVVYVAADDVLQARYVSDGSALWTYRERYGGFESLAITGTLLLAGTDDGTVRAFGEGEAVRTLTDATTLTRPAETPPE